jgi:prolipoprotein diacylglyceryltransferase
VLLILFKKGKKYEMPIYMMAYAVWRFVAELMRNDYRGATVVDFLTPSQFISVLLLAGGLILLGIELYVDGKKRVAAAEIAAADVAEADASEVETDAADTVEGESPD